MTALTVDRIARVTSAEISERPALSTSHASIATAFDGDYTGAFTAHAHTLSGDALGVPTTGYHRTPETSAAYIWGHNLSGHNEQTGGVDGRTMGSVVRIRATQYGQGDYSCLNLESFTNSVKPGATHYLANPASQVIASVQSAGCDGAAIQNELRFVDNGYDIHCAPLVLSLDRRNKTGNLNAWWPGLRVQAVGTEEIDVGVSISGPVRHGVDVSSAVVDEAALALGPDQTISFNAKTTTDSAGLKRFADTDVDDVTMKYNPTTQALEIAFQGNVIAHFNADGFHEFGNRVLTVKA